MLRMLAKQKNSTNTAKRQFYSFCNASPEFFNIKRRQISNLNFPSL